MPSEQPQQQVAMVVFATVPGADERDAALTGVVALRAALRAYSATPDGTTIQARFRSGDVPVTVHKVVDVATAARSGYLGVTATPGAFRR